jgi:Arc/MetJ-type ribon-helix-helix transcriptional regulator
MASVRVSIRIPAELRRKIEREGRSVSDVVRDALSEHVSKIRKQETCYDLALRLGVIGSAKNAPRDLNTNRRHFRGFGKSAVRRDR